MYVLETEQFLGLVAFLLHLHIEKKFENHHAAKTTKLEMTLIERKCRNRGSNRTAFRVVHGLLPIYASHILRHFSG